MPRLPAPSTSLDTALGRTAAVPPTRGGQMAEQAFACAPAGAGVLSWSDSHHWQHRVRSGPLAR
eukprot:14772654-Alexandrium_andersonii.AAC.1